MMAPDSSFPRRQLSAASIEGLEKALSRFLADPADTGSLESALRALTAEAREKQMHAEQLLVLLKDVWFGLPQIKQAPSGEPQNTLLQRAVTQCIREYYGG